ncbi:MAG: RDD family protein [Coprobacillus sp.]|nr:RDD family protein [Coprobacillus sp.]
MNFISLKKRAVIYLLDFILVGAISFLGLIALYINGHWSLAVYLLSAAAVDIELMFLYEFLLVYFTNGYTLFSFICNGRVMMRGDKVSINAAILRALYECIIVFPIVSFFFLIIKHSDMSVIDRLSETYFVVAR